MANGQWDCRARRHGGGLSDRFTFDSQARPGTAHSADTSSLAAGVWLHRRLSAGLVHHTIADKKETEHGNDRRICRRRLRARARQTGNTWPLPRRRRRKAPQVAKLFRAAAEAETVHAHAHLRVLGGVKTTAENLKAAIDGEAYEFKTMYPQFVSEAEAEKNQAAIISFRNAMAVEQIHHDLYSKRLQAVKGKDLPAARDLRLRSVRQHGGRQRARQVPGLRRGGRSLWRWREGRKKTSPVRGTIPVAGTPGHSAHLQLGAMYLLIFAHERFSETLATRWRECLGPGEVWQIDERDASALQRRDVLPAWSEFWEPDDRGEWLVHGAPCDGIGGPPDAGLFRQPGDVAGVVRRGADLSNT